MLDEIETVARVFYLTSECARGWEREPEILKAGFRLKAKLVINTIDGFRRQSSPPTGIRAQTAPPDLDLPGFLAVLSGPRHVFHMANKAHRHLTGHRALIDKPVREALPELKEQGCLDLLDEVYETGRSYTGSHKLLRIRTRRNGSLEERLLNITYKPIVNECGERLGIIVEGRDITGLIQLSP